jgi:hypothetical protein
MVNAVVGVSESAIKCDGPPTMRYNHKCKSFKVKSDGSDLVVHLETPQLRELFDVLKQTHIVTLPVPVNLRTAMQACRTDPTVPPTNVASAR